MASAAAGDNEVGSCFDKGATVEVSLEEEGFRGSWFVATVVSPVSKKTNKIHVEFQTLMTDDHPNSKRLRQHVHPLLLRPLPPREPMPHVFQLSDEVDAFHNDGWWEGIVTQVIPAPYPPLLTTYSVFFRSSREQIFFTAIHLRLHREWVHGQWVPPLSQ